MHWGHQSTEDFIHWDLEKTALAPDEPYDSKGCFSGNAMADGGRLYLAYTSVDDGLNQQQCVAVSSDGEVFRKLPSNPVIRSESLPRGFSREDFRDPKIFRRGGRCFLIMGNEADDGSKQIICYSAPSPEGPYSYLGVTHAEKGIRGIFECPGLARMGDKDVLIASPQGMHDGLAWDFQNDDSCVYAVGRFSPRDGSFTPDGGPLSFEEFDKGPSFYAPETLEASDGRVILVAWMRSWVEPNATKDDLWCGSMTLPRELSLIDGHIYQAPVREAERYRRNERRAAAFSIKDGTKRIPGFEGTKAEISFSLDASHLGGGTAGVRLYERGSSWTSIHLDGSTGLIVFDRDHSSGPMKGKRFCKLPLTDGRASFRIFLDVNSVEAFLGDGYFTMTGTTFQDPSFDGVSFFAEGGEASFGDLIHYDIIA